MPVLAALRRALPVFLSARLLAVVLLPLVAAAIACVVAGAWAFDPLVDWVAGRVFGAATGWGSVAAAVVVLLAFVGAALAMALVAIAVLAMPVIVRAVAARDFPALERRRGGTFAGSIANAIATMLVFVPLWLASFVLLSLPPLFVAVSLALSAWLNQRLLRYDALAEHADAGEMRAIFRAARGRLMGLGLLLAPLSYVPVVNIAAPLYAGVAFTYLCLGELAARRAAAAPQPAER